MRRTKIVATIGPASQELTVLTSMLEAGVDVLRFNFSHASPDRLNLIKNAVALAEKLDRPLGIMADLQGPKIRIGQFKNKAIQLIQNKTFFLDCKRKEELGDESWVFVDYPSLCQELSVGDHLLLDDGLIELEVTSIKAPLIETKVVEGGTLSNNKGINRKGGGLSARTLTDKDKEDLQLAVHAGVDYISLSFVKDAEDLRQARKLIKAMAGKNIPIIAKIERCEALVNLKEIILEADALMVARGDLGVEVGAAEVPAIQKKIIEESRKLNKIVITATQMMESMINHAQPTRAEVSDVANAILDGTDAVMLSAETATGLYPIKVIQMVDKVCLSAEKHAAFYYANSKDNSIYQSADQAIAMAAMHAANHFPVQAIVSLTQSGATAVWLSRQQSSVPIYALTSNRETVRRLSLVNNVFPIFYDYRKLPRNEINNKIIAFLIEQSLLEKNNYILLTRGSIIGKNGGTNRLEIIST